MATSEWEKELVSITQRCAHVWLNAPLTQQERDWLANCRRCVEHIHGRLRGERLIAKGAMDNGRK